MQIKSVVIQKVFDVSRISLASSSGGEYCILPTTKCKLSLRNGQISCSFAAKPQKRGPSFKVKKLPSFSFSFFLFFSKKIK